MELLGLIDALEAQLLQGHRIPLTHKLVVDDDKILDLLDKIRLVIKSGPDVVRSSLNRSDTRGLQADTIRAAQQLAQETTLSQSEVQKKAAEIINSAYEVASEIQNGAKKYADDVLANLLVIATRLERNIESGRSRLSQTLGVESQAAAAPAEPAQPTERQVKIPNFASDAKTDRIPVETASRLNKYQTGAKKLIDDLDL